MLNMRPEFVSAATPGEGELPAAPQFSQFGKAVAAMSGSRIAVGAPGADGGGAQCGEVWIMSIADDESTIVSDAIILGCADLSLSNYAACARRFLSLAPAACADTVPVMA